MFKKIVFMGTPNFAVPILKSLYQRGCSISAVYCQPPKKSMRGQKINKSPIQKFSENINLNVRNPNFLQNNKKELEYFKSISPDIVVVVAYGKLIPKQFLSLAKHGFLNIHASLLPTWRGAAPIQRAIMNLDNITGISVMRLVEEIDAGPLMFKKEIKLNKEMNTEDVSNKLSKLGSEIILDCLDLIEISKAKFVDQDHNQATYAKKIDKNETKINWYLDDDKVVSHIHGLSPNPGAWFKYKNERFKVLRVKKSIANGNPGIVLDENLTVGCKSGSIQIVEIQREGKNRQSAKDFLRGKKISKDSVLA